MAKGRIFKRIAMGLAVLVVLLVGFVVVHFYVLLPHVSPAKTMKAEATPENIAHGKYLAMNVLGCMGCHSHVNDGVPGEPLDPSTLGGGRDFDLPGFPGHVRAPNITPDTKVGIGNWSDGEIVRAMREGISRDGRALFPIMPYVTYGKVLTDEDALSVVAYLRSITPLTSDPGETEIAFPVSMFIRGVPAPVLTPAPAPPPESDKLGRGRWLIQAASCPECHTPQDDHGQPIVSKRFAGGLALSAADKGMVRTSNITSDPDTGIGQWSDAEVRGAIEGGTSKDGHALYCMPWSFYQRMTESDKTALVAAIREIPAVHNEVPHGPQPAHP